MKIKVYVVDARPPRWLRRALVFGAVPLVILGLGALVYASAVTGQPDYNDGDVLTAATLNAHLGALQTQINTLTTGEGVIPAGSIMAYGGGTAPSGWMLCDGAAVSRTTYAALLAAIGVLYGAGDGLETFNLPDLRQRFPLGMASSGTGSTLGGSGGAIDHAHSFTPGGIVSQPAFAGSAGATANDGVDHTHAGPSHVHDMQNHTHVTDIGSFTSGAGSAHVHAAGGLYFQVAELVNSGGSRYMYFNSNTSSPASWVQVQRTDNNGVGDGTSTGTKFIDGYPSAGQTTNYYTANGSGASSSEASHTHTIDPPSTGSGGPSNNTTTAGGTGSTSGASAYSHSHGFTPAGTVSQPSFTGSAGTTASGNPPFLVVNYIIKY